MRMILSMCANASIKVRIDPPLGKNLAPAPGKQWVIAAPQKHRQD